MITAGEQRAGSAHYGWRDWLLQRATAVILLLYTLLVIGIVMWHGRLDYPVWQAMFANGAFRLATFLCLMALLFHTWVGVRNIAMDYVKPTGLRLLIQMVVISVLVAYAGWTIQILWGVL